MIPVVIVLLVSFIFSSIFKGTDKVDEGFKINYFKLSYRRKMIRTLITIPIISLAFFVIYFYTEASIGANILFGLFFLILFSVQLIYNFYMWKQYER
ncbi:hypothetical protein C1N55_07085 [Lysinibacillus sp. SGAir0095]|nr:hypothetical protein C1N55_07085 [Lysinibacillus sp. SGAir0095]